MMTAELGACEWFVWDLRRSNLVERGKLEQLVAEYMARHPKAEPAELAAHLVDQRILTRFQADSLLNGKSQGLVLGTFIVHDILGSGTMGTVYKARSKVNNEWYAVKVLPRRSMWNIRLARRKVRDFEQFNHATVVPFVDVGTAGAMHYLAWPLVDGEPLNKVVEKRGRLSAPETALYGMLAAEGLDAAHQRQILHGLLKPSNLMVTGDQHVKILDFGVGSLLLEAESGESVVDTMSSANTLASGLDCASPEGIMDPAAMSFPADQYGLGCILYYCLTGQYPFPGNNAVEKMMAHQSKQPKSIRELAPDCPDEFVEVIERLMKKNPSDRYGSMSEVAAALRPVAMMASAAAVPARGTNRRAQAAPASPAPMARPATTMMPPPPPIVVEENGYGDGYISPAARPSPNPFPSERQPAFARPTPQPVAAFEETVADASMAPAGYAALRENLQQPQYDPRYPQRGAVMAPPPEYYQQRQGYGLGTIVMVMLMSVALTMAGLIGLFVWAVKSGFLKQLLNQVQ
jgi:serine/threonine protein kinase